MKKILSAVVVSILVVSCLLALASCGGKTLSGLYVADAGIASTSYEFSGKNVEITYEFFGFEKHIEGTYEIATDENGQSSITFTIESDEEGAEDYKGEHTFVEGVEGDVEYIKIDGVKFIKE